MLITILLVFILISLSILFSIGETSLTGASEARVYHKLKGNPGALKRVKKLLRGRERIIAVLLIGNNLVNVSASVLTTGACVKLWGEQIGMLISTLLMSAVIVVFAEILPKTYAVKYADRALLPLTSFILASAFVFRPISWVTNTLTQWVFRFSKTKEPVVSPHEDLMGVIDLHHKEGGFVKSDRDMLGGILTLTELTVGDVMIHRKNIVAIDMDQPSQDLVQEILKSSHTRLPLYQQDAENIVGIIHAKDVLVALAGAQFKPEKIDFSSIIKAPWFVPESTKLKDQLNRFLIEKNHFALVVDEYGALMGLITLEDILEEIVGNIVDEHDIGDEAGGIYVQDDGSYLIRGDVPIRDVNRILDLDLPDEEATTMAGLVICTIQAIPESGQVFSFYDFRFEILKRQNNQITLMRVTPIASTKAE